MPAPTRRRPEILAPAGDLASLRAALAAGADAVYFGLDDGFNARARAENFSLATLADTVALVHHAGARAYLTVNTLVFEPELPVVEDLLRKVAAAGVDALIVQDPAIALIARALCPQLEVHASTQMTVSSGEGARFAAGLGVTRMVVPRELSVAEIRALAAATPLELEVFIHGALCVSWSGQCLTSEAWGGRSANRGQCAQSCRMPYDLVVDCETRDLGEVKYLLSPKDLAGVQAVPDLVDVGVHGLKIEGRQKGPVYVASAVEGYRRWVDSIVAGAPDEAALERDLAAMSLAYTRGFSAGFLGGSDHQTLVEGRFPKSRGALLGRVVAVRGHDVLVADERERPWTGALGLGPAATRPAAPEGTPSAPLPALELAPAPEPRPGLGVGFDTGHPEEAEPGGPIFRVAREPGGHWRLGFGQPGPDLARVRPGDRVWLSGDPAAAAAVDKRIAAPLQGGRRVSLRVSGTAGVPLTVEAKAGAVVARATGDVPLAAARGAGLDAALLTDKLGALGGTAWRLAGSIDTGGLAPGLFVPPGELKELRRRLVAALDAAAAAEPPRAVRMTTTLGELRAGAVPAPRAGAVPATPRVIPMCRTDAQLEAVIAARAAGAALPEVELDWMELVGLGKAVARAREAGLAVTIATVRVHKPGEEGYDGRVARLQPDAVLVRHWGALVAFAERARAGAEAGPRVHGDFSLNVTNSITAAHLLGWGLDTITAAHDLDAVQLFALLDHAPAERVTVAVHHHIPTFHTEHCVYSHLLSNGRDHRSCGRPCEAHAVALRDRAGLEHPVVVDVGCRNTVFNAPAQSAAALVPKLLARGVRRFRVELVRESRAEAAAVLAAYGELVAGRLAPAEVVRRVGVHEQFGVTRGTMKVLA